ELDPYFATQTTLPLSVIVMRLLIAMVCGAAIGFERERKNTAAGLRTHILVCLSSGIVAILTIEIAHHSAFQGQSARVDPLRLIEAITAGVAFLAAGMIVFSKGEVRGLTTGAGLWFSGAIGLSAGLGFWHVSLVATAMALIVLWLLQGLGALIAPNDAE
ncbi:MAG: MgtC/SapB family protein, partial [Rhizobium sp.]|nr:MgtC/SapB family protein [Rhizobium sp.]